MFRGVDEVNWDDLEPYDRVPRLYVSMELKRKWQELKVALNFVKL